MSCSTALRIKQFYNLGARNVFFAFTTMAWLLNHVYRCGVISLTILLFIVSKTILSYDVAVIQWINSCHENRMTTRVITFWRVDVKALTMSVKTMRFLFEILPSLKAIKSSFKRSYDEQNLTLVVISYEIYETRRRLV